MIRVGEPLEELAAESIDFPPFRPPGKTDDFELRRAEKIPFPCMENRSLNRHTVISAVLYGNIEEKELEDRRGDTA